MIVSLGDLLLDVIVRLRQPLAEGADADAITRLGPGGQAANVAAWVAELGGQARFVGKRAGDEAGGIAAHGLERYGVEIRGPLVDGRTGTVVSLVAEDGARTMATDRGVSPEFRVDELDPAWLDGCTHLHLPGYSLLRSPIDEVALQAAELHLGSASTSPPGARSATSGRSAFASGSRRCSRRSCSQTRMRNGSSAARLRAASGC